MISTAGLLVKTVTTEPNRLLIVARPTAADAACIMTPDDEAVGGSQAERWISPKTAVPTCVS